MHFHATRKVTIFVFTAFLIGGADTPVGEAQTVPTPQVGFDSPALRYSTTFGGNAGVEGRAIALDADGNTIVAGTTTDTFGFPLVNAADDDPGSASEEGFVAKINAAGDDVLFSTFLGGDREDRITDVGVDANGNIYVVGLTGSGDFPTTAGSLQPSLGNEINDPFFESDGFVTKLDPSGNIVWSTYLGGDSTDEAHGVHVGDDGTVYVVGMAMSADFPSTSGSYQEDCNENFNLCHDAFVVRLAANGKSLVFGTFLGGMPLGEAACSVDVDPDGNVFVAGHYTTDGFPYVDAFQDFHDAGSDWFVTKFTPDGDDLVWSSGLGGNGQEATCNRFQIGPSVALDGNGDAFVGALTTSTNLTASGTFQTTFGGTTDGYLAKIASDGTFEWGTYFGGDRNEGIRDIAVLDDGSPVIVGSSDSLNFPETPDALEENDCSMQAVSCSPDAFAAILTTDGTDLEFSTQLGGGSTDEATGVAVGAGGTLYIGGLTPSGGGLWPQVDPLPAPLQGSGRSAFVARIGDDAAPIPGDVNGDGSVTASDALGALAAALGIRQCLLCVCDLNGDGSISATDALLILNLAVGFMPPTNPPPC
jgi:hypothetical protein